MESKFERKIEDIVDQLKTAKDNGRKCTLLIGAGCSVTAGIPIANEIVEEIKNKHKRAYDRAKQKDYGHCMEELLDGERRDLIVKYIDEAKVNWAHMCIGLLIQEGYVDRVLTVNFDPLVARACALLGKFPAIYDFAASKNFESDRIPDIAVFHLHGQHTGFVHLHTTRDVEGHVDSFAPVFEDAGRNRTWVVVGYSGENDPVFKHLAEVKKFNRGLYWIGYEQKEPAEHVREGLLIPDKGAFFTKGYDADSFFIKLTQELEIFPPKFVTHPFTHLQGTFEDLQPFILPDQSEDILSDTRSNINKAIEKYEKGDEDKLVAEALRLSMAGDYEELVKLCKKHTLTTHPQLIEPSAWAFIMLGIDLQKQAQTKTGEEADVLFAQAGEKYQEALKIKPDMHYALYNWGVTLDKQASTKSGEEADKLFAEAREKYQQVLNIEPNFYRAIFNMACLAALTGDEKGCRVWLEKRIEQGSFTEEESMNDPDLDSVRELGWFKKLVAKSKKKKE